MSCTNKKLNEYADYDCNGNITRLRRCGLVDNMHGGFGLRENWGRFSMIRFLQEIFCET
jgi:hypothetical protein